MKTDWPAPTEPGWWWARARYWRPGVWEVVQVSWLDDITLIVKIIDVKDDYWFTSEFEWGPRVQKPTELEE